MTSLTSYRNIFASKKVVFTTLALIVLLMFVIPILLLRQPELEPKDIPPSVQKQSAKDGILDKDAPVNQASRNEIEKITPKLPYRKIIKTKNGSSVTYTIFSKPTTPYSLYVGILGVRLLIDEKDPEYEKNKEDFTEAATEVISWLKSEGVETNEVFIIWGDTAVTQKTAESWLESINEPATSPSP